MIGASYGAVGDGWVHLYGDGYPGSLYVRVEADERGRLRIHDLVMRGEWRYLVAQDFRELHLERIEEWLQEGADLITGLASRAPVPGLSDFFEAFGERPEPKPGPRIPRLQRPTERPLSADFLRHVAAAHRQAVSEGKAPAPELARQVGDGCTPRTIHKWVSLARERGIMPPAARRKAGE